MKRIVLMAMATVFPLAVAANPMPVSGFWYPAGSPGTGIFIDRVADTLVVSVAGYAQDGQPKWMLASGSVVSGVFEAPLLVFGDGACPGCPYRPPVVDGDDSLIRMEFVHSSRAWMRIDDAPLQLISRFEFGGGWLADFFAGGDNAGPVFLPSVAGRWAIAGPGEEASGFFDFPDLVIDAEDPSIAAAWSVPFDQPQPAPMTDIWGLVCRDEESGSGCQFIIAKPSTTFFTLVAEPALADVAPQGIHGLPAVGFPEAVAARRLPLEAAALPEIGFWFDPQAAGSGWFIDRVNDTLVVMQASYDTDGHAEWRLASGTLDEHGRFDAPLLLFRDGTCNGCDYRTPVVDDDGSRLALEFVNDRQAHLEVNGATLELIRFEFGGARLDRHSFAAPALPEIAWPDLGGMWLLALTRREGGTGPEPGIVRLSEDAVAGESSRSWTVFVEPALFSVGSVVCTAGEDIGPLPRCTLELTHWRLPDGDTSPPPPPLLFDFDIGHAAYRVFRGQWSIADFEDSGGAAYGFRLED
ncbi:MAG TPA: hypothetical protein PKZ76_15825 [Xanthomonadaceae bacterium]|nr:hypothetical protein [Xanthomonadaceae bacterium]